MQNGMYRFHSSYAPGLRWGRKFGFLRRPNTLKKPAKKQRFQNQATQNPTHLLAARDGLLKLATDHSEAKGLCEKHTGYCGLSKVDDAITNSIVLIQTRY